MHLSWRNFTCVFLIAVAVGTRLVFAIRKDQHFTLTARLLPPIQKGTSLRLRIELHNVSLAPQQVIMLPSPFEGNVYLRDLHGDVHEFVHTNYWNLQMTTSYIRPTLQVPPGASLTFEHPLSEFIDTQRMQTVTGGNSSYVAYPILSKEFQQGCEMWCSLDTTSDESLTVITPTIGFPQ